MNRSSGSVRCSASCFPPGQRTRPASAGMYENDCCFGSGGWVLRGFLLLRGLSLVAVWCLRLIGRVARWWAAASCRCIRGFCCTSRVDLAYLIRLVLLLVPDEALRSLATSSGCLAYACTRTCSQLQLKYVRLHARPLHAAMIVVVSTSSRPLVTMVLVATKMHVGMTM